MIVAGIGCRRGCSANDVVVAVRAAEARSACTAVALAAPDFKRDEPGLHDAAVRLGLPIRFIARDALLRAQSRCVTHSAAALDATGLSSVAEAAALAAAGAPLRLLRIQFGAATCALAGPS